MLVLRLPLRLELLALLELLEDEVLLVLLVLLEADVAKPKETCSLVDDEAETFSGRSGEAQRASQSERHPSSNRVALALDVLELLLCSCSSLICR